MVHRARRWRRNRLSVPVSFSRPRKEVGFFELALGMLFAEVARQAHGPIDCRRVERGAVGALLRHAFDIDQQHTTQDAVFSHQILHDANVPGVRSHGAGRERTKCKRFNCDDGA